MHSEHNLVRLHAPVLFIWLHMLVYFLKNEVESIIDD